MKKLLSFLALYLFVVSSAEALTTVNKYVTTTCSDNGDGTAASCAASPGAAGAYKTLQQAIDDIVADTPNFVASDITVNIHCAGSTADTGTGSTDAAVTIDGLTLDATRKLQIIADVADRHDGKWNTSKYRLSGSYYRGVIWLKETFVTIAWLQLDQTKTSASGGTPGSGIYIDIAGATSGRILFAENILRYTGDYTNQNAYAFDDQHNETSGVDKLWFNNIMYDFVRGIEMRPEASDDLTTYNNTCYSNQAGPCYVVRGNGGGSVTMTAKNNLANGSASGWDIDVSAGGTWTHDGNLSEDTTSPDNTWDSKAVLFADEAGDDYHLDAGDTAALDQGVDLSGASPENLTIDVDNDTRTGSWDIGADEFVGGGGGGGGSDDLPLLLEELGGL